MLHYEWLEKARYLVYPNSLLRGWSWALGEGWRQTIQAMRDHGGTAMQKLPAAEFAMPWLLRLAGPMPFFSTPVVLLSEHSQSGSVSNVHAGQFQYGGLLSPFEPKLQRHWRLRLCLHHVAACGLIAIVVLVLESCHAA
jgi:hypothetical protein